MNLTVSMARKAQAREKDYKLAAGKGLFLLIKKNGRKYWRLKYRVAGKEKLLALGVFPEVTLAEAEIKRDEARKLIREGVDPSQARKDRKIAQKGATANSFEAIARDWMKKRGKKSESGDKRLDRIMEKDLLPALGRLPISEITPPQLLAALRRIEDRGALNTAHKAKQYAGQVFRYAIASGQANRDPSTDLKGALATPKSKHFAAIVEPKEVGRLLVAIDNYQGTPTVLAALKLSALLFCRQGELRHLEWSEINWDESRIELPAAKMKINEPHIIPLSRQALEVLEELKAAQRGKYVFPSARGASRPLSENAARTALRTMGYTNDDMTPHGFRAMARTLLEEVLHFPITQIEQQLAHTVRDTHGRAYNRTKHLEARKAMMQRWADYLDSLRAQTINKNVLVGNF